MSEQGLCSRREADDYIAKGWVKVDGVTVSELGTKILPTQKITLERAAQARQEGRVTILLHKPVGYVSGQAEEGYKPAILLLDASTHWAQDTSPQRFHRSQLQIGRASCRERV